jgi:hypothetical protein
MSALYRFGFEGGYLPRGISVSGSYMLTDGRSGSGSKAISSIDTDEVFVSMASKEPASEIYITEYVKISSYGLGGNTTLLKFGDVCFFYYIMN